MSEYKALYFKLLNANCEAIRILTEACQEAEEIIMNMDEQAYKLALYSDEGDNGE